MGRAASRQGISRQVRSYLECKGATIQTSGYLNCSDFSPGQEEASELVNFFGVVCVLAACVHIHGILVILFLNFSFSPFHLCNVEIRVMERVPAALDKEDKALKQQ